MVVLLGAGLVVPSQDLVESPTLRIDDLGRMIRPDALTTIMLVMIMLVMVALLGETCLRVSATDVGGEEHRGVFLGRLAATIVAVEVLVRSGTLARLVLAWIATSLAPHVDDTGTVFDRSVGDRQWETRIVVTGAGGDRSSANRRPRRCPGSSSTTSPPGASPGNRAFLRATIGDRVGPPR